MGNHKENYADAYARYMEVIAKTQWRSMDDKINMQLAVGKVLAAAYDFGSAEKEATWKPNSIHEVF